MATAIAQAGTANGAAELISSVRLSALQPVSCEWIGPENEIWVRVAEHPKAVEWQLRNLPPADWKILEGNEEEAAWEKLRVRYRRNP